MSAVRTWTGFRAATPDKLPLIGPWPEDKSLFLATGHEGLGITTSLATARILVDGIMGATAEIPIGWGAVVESSGALDLVHKPAWHDVSTEHNLRFLERIARASTRAINRNLGIKTEVEKPRS